jgi:hypothetical protein
MPFLLNRTLNHLMSRTTQLKPLKFHLFEIGICLSVLFLVIVLPFYVSAHECEIESETGIVLHVSPKGNDKAEGSEKAPLKSLQGAQDRLRIIRKQKTQQSVTVLVHGGSYVLDKPVHFGREDSGSEKYPVIYQAAAGEKPVFSGSRKLTKWKKLTDKKLLARLDPAVRGKVLVTDVRKAGITDFGDPTDRGLRPEFFVDETMQTLARWPNKEMTTAGRAIGQTPLPPTYIAKTGTKEGLFEYLGERHDRWAAEKDPRLGGYWYWDWAEEFQKVEAIDTLKKIIKIRQPYHNYGYKDGLRYFGLNLFCEIDSPGEWYLDRTSGLMYWYPASDVDISEASMRLSLFSAPFMVEMIDCEFLTLSGLTFEESRGSAVAIKGGKNCLISDCRMERFGADGIHIEQGSGHGVSGCLMRSFGFGGIKMSGGDRKTLTPGGHFVEQTVIEHFSLFKRTYQPAIHMEGCGQRISNNRFRYSSSSAFRLEGNDFLIENNEVSHVVNESDDQGGIDIFYNPSYRGIVIRYNHWSDIAGGTLHGAAGVRLDDMISGVEISGNVFERCGVREFGAVQIHGGKDNLVDNNLFFDCLAAVSFSSWGEKRWLNALDSPVIRKKIYEDVNINSDLYLKRYPALADMRVNIDVNTVRNNLLIDCKKVFLRGGKGQITENNHVVQSNGKKIAEFYDIAYLKSLGMKPIPFDSMGPKKNRWVNP